MKHAVRTKAKKNPLSHYNKPVEGDILKEVLARLQRLRTLARQTTRTYLANVEKGILDVSDQLSTPARKGETKQADLATLQDVNLILTNLKLKPEKGRRKDLRKIEEAIGEMLSLLEKGQT